MCDTIKEALYFDSVKMVTVRNFKLGLFHRTIQLAVIVYIAVFAIWYKQGYQEASEISGVIYTKMKGVASDNPQHQGITIDANDLIIPASENGAIFLATRSLSTIQSQGNCTDDSAHNDCVNGTQCKAGASTSNGWVIPGECNTKLHKCNISAWCPVENEEQGDFTTYFGVENFTLFIRSEIVYDKWKIQVSNAAERKEGVNQFSVYEMLTKAGIEGDDLTDVFYNGTIINIQLDWSCNLDEGVESCKPVFTFARIDTARNASSHGFNFRRTLYFNNNITDSTPVRNVYTTRVLTKFYGIRFVLQVKGLGRKFDIFAVAITVGSGIAFLAVATLATDVILQYCHPNKDKFKKAKHNHIRFDDEESALINEDTVSSEIGLHSK